MRALLVCLLLVFSSAAPAHAAPETLSVKAGKAERELILNAPASTRRPVPVVLVFHGGGGGADWMAAKSRTLTRTFTEAGYAVVYTDGSSRRNGDKLRTWNAGHCCAYAQRRKIDEAAYINAAVDLLDQRIGIDRSRIFLVGHSNGAMLTYRVAGQMKDAPRAIAPVSGAIFADQPAIPARTSIFMYHARNDEVLSYSGNPDDKAERWRTAPHLGFVEAEARLAGMKSCGAPATLATDAGLTVTRRPCAAGTVLMATTSETGGHEWASRPASGYQIEAALLSFFNSLD